MHAAGQRRLAVAKLVRIAEHVDRRAADRRQEHLEVLAIDQIADTCRRSARAGRAARHARSRRSARRCRGDTTPDRSRPSSRGRCRCSDHDVAVGANASGLDRGANFRHVDMRAGDRDGRPDVVAKREIFAEFLTDEMAPRIERDDLRCVGPLRMRADAVGGRGVGQVGTMVARQCACGDRQRAVYRIAAGMRADGVAVPAIAVRRDDRTARGRGRCAPMQCRRPQPNADRRDRRSRISVVEKRIRSLTPYASPCS